MTSEVALYESILNTLETSNVPKDMLKIYGQLILDQWTNKTVTRKQLSQINVAISRKFNIANLGYIKRRSLDLLERQGLITIN